MRYAIRRQFLWFGIGFVLAIMIGCSASQKGMYDRSEPSASVAAVRSNAPANKIITETSSIEKTATAKDSEKVQVQWTANESWKRSKLQDHRVRLLINDQTEILLKQSHLHVKVDGFRARVVLDLQFAKAAQDRTEATFQLRLANGANPYYLAFGNTQYAIGDQSAAMRSQEIQKILNKSHAIKDIQQGVALNNVAMREARFAPKKRAAQAYHDTVRRKVDPALLEWAGGGVYNGRVFPLSSQLDNRIIVGYDVDLDRRDGRYLLNFSLPKQEQQRLLDVEVTPAARASVRMGDYKSMPPTSKQRRYHLVNPDRSEFELELVTSDAVILSGHDGASGNYFAANWLPSFDRPLSIKPDAGPLNAVFLLDVSSSREPAYFNRAVMLVKRILARNPDQIKNFNILLYSSKHAWYSDQWTTNNEPARLILDQFLNTLELRGAAKLGSALKAALNSPWTQGKQLPTALFLVSEDSSSQGDASLEYLVRTVKDFPHTKIFGYNTSPRASATLNTIAKISGGASFQVHKDKEVELLAGAHREPYWEIQDIKVAGIRDLLIKGGSTHITSGQSITIAGRGKVTPKAVIEYRVAGTKGAALLRTPIRSIISSTLAPRVYGQIAVENMLSSVPGEHDVPNQFSEHFRIVSPQMSMVMLESEYDFENFGIRLVDHTAKIQKTLVSSWIAQNQYQSVSSALKVKLATGVKNTQFKTGNVSELTAELLAILNSANSSDPALAVELAINKDYFVKHRNYGDANSDPRDPVHVALDLGSVHVQNVNLGEEPTRDYFQLLAQKRYAELFYLSAALVQPNPDGRILSILASAAEHLQKPEIALAAYEMALHFSETDEYNTRVTGLKLRVFLARLLKNSRVSRSLQDYARLRLESHELKSAGPVATPHIVVDPALRESPRFWRSPKTKVKLVGAKNTGISDLLGGTLIYENKDLTTTVSVPLKTEFNHYTLACSRRRTHSPIQLRVTVVSLADTRYQLVSCPERFKFTP